MDQTDNKIILENKYCVTLHNMFLESKGVPLDANFVFDKPIEYGVLEDRFTFKNIEE